MRIRVRVRVRVRNNVRVKVRVRLGLGLDQNHRVLSVSRGGVVRLAQENGDLT